MQRSSRRLAVGIAASLVLLGGAPTLASAAVSTDSPASSASSEKTSDANRQPDTRQLPEHFLTGYWQNFVNQAEPLRLSDVPAEYDLVAVAFGESTGTAGEVGFTLDPELSDALGGYTEDNLRADIQALQERGTSVILSVGGELGNISVTDPASAEAFATSVADLMDSYGFDGVDIDLEHGLDPTHMAQALRSLHEATGDPIITMAPQTVDMQSTDGSYFQLALEIQDILTVVHMQYYNSGSMSGCDGTVYEQGGVDFLTALACIQLEGGLSPDQVALGLPAGPGAAGSGIVEPGVVTDALDCLAAGTNCGSFTPSNTYPAIRGAMTWSINWDASNGYEFSQTVGSHLDSLS